VSILPPGWAGRVLPGLKGQPYGAAPRAEEVAIAQHGRTHPFFLEKRPVGRIEIFQVDHLVADLQDAMMARDLRIIQRDVGTLAAKHSPRVCQSE